VRVFVAGASGVIGRAAVPQLLAAGHEVAGTTRSEEKAGAIRAAGAEAVVVDVYEAERLGATMAAFRPEVVVHLLTALPRTLDFDALGPTNRLRTEGTRILVEAARAAGARRLVAESIAFIYRPEGGWVKDEEAPVSDDAPPPFGDAIRCVLDMERQVTEADGMEGIVLRFGQLYGPGTYYAPGADISEQVRKRRFPVVGGGHGMASFLHTGDAGGATVAAVESGAMGVYNVTDDEPASMSEWLPAYARALGAKRPMRIPALVARLMAPKQVVEMATAARGASNARARRDLGWSPRLPSWRQGFQKALD
jgi:nucleoside-diphosphate-sugar epimerase